MEQEAERQIATRNRLYVIATAAAARSDWPTAVDALTTMQEVQPAYGDTVALLEQARTRAFNAGLSGLAYLKNDNSHPGLYVRDANGHSTYLDGTDSRSVIRAVNGNTIVYDRPAGKGLPGTNAPAQFLRSRHLPTRRERPHTGAYPHRHGGQPVVHIAPRVERRRYRPAQRRRHLVVQPTLGKCQLRLRVVLLQSTRGRSPGVTRVSDRQSGKNVLAIDLARSRVAITEAVPEAESDFSGSRLYIAGANGEKMKLVQVVPGTISQASFSRDGNWLLFSTQQGSVDIQRSVYVMPLNGGRVATRHSRKLRYCKPWRGAASRWARISAPPSCPLRTPRRGWS